MNEKTEIELAASSTHIVSKADILLCKQILQDSIPLLNSAEEEKESWARINLIISCAIKRKNFSFYFANNNFKDPLLIKYIPTLEHTNTVELKKYLLSLDDQYVKSSTLNHIYNVCVDLKNNLSEYIIRFSEISLKSHSPKKNTTSLISERLIAYLSNQKQNSTEEPQIKESSTDLKNTIVMRR